jgi:ATP synthase protein I
MIKLPQPNSRQRAIAGHQGGTGGTSGAGHQGEAARAGHQGRVARQDETAGLESGLSIASYPLGGVLAYGLIGWLVATLIHASWPIPIGMVLGLAIGTAYVIYRYGTETGRARAEAALAKAQARKADHNNPPKGD